MPGGRRRRSRLNKPGSAAAAAAAIGNPQTPELLTPPRPRTFSRPHCGASYAAAAAAGEQQLIRRCAKAGAAAAHSMRWVRRVVFDDSPPTVAPPPTTTSSRRQKQTWSTWAAAPREGESKRRDGRDDGRSRCEPATHRNRQRLSSFRSHVRARRHQLCHLSMTMTLMTLRRVPRRPLAFSAVAADRGAKRARVRMKSERRGSGWRQLRTERDCCWPSRSDQAVRSAHLWSVRVVVRRCIENGLIANKSRPSKRTIIESSGVWTHSTGMFSAICRSPWRTGNKVTSISAERSPDHALMFCWWLFLSADAATKTNGRRSMSRKRSIALTSMQQRALIAKTRKAFRRGTRRPSEGDSSRIITVNS